MIPSVSCDDPLGSVEGQRRRVVALRGGAGRPQFVDGQTRWVGLVAGVVQLFAVVHFPEHMAMDFRDSVD